MLLLLLCDVNLYYVFILSVSLSSESADDSDDVNDDFRPDRQNVKKRVCCCCRYCGVVSCDSKKVRSLSQKENESLFFRL